MIIESPQRIEPCFLYNPSPEVIDLIADVSSASQRLAKGLHPRTANSLAQLIRIMNCYYSNLIEGHNTTPREIETALANLFDASEERRNLQLEARSLLHIKISIA